MRHKSDRAQIKAPAKSRFQPLNPFNWITPFEAACIFFAALGFLFLLANAPLEAFRFAYQEL